MEPSCDQYDLYDFYDFCDFYDYTNSGTGSGLSVSTTCLQLVSVLTLINHQADATVIDRRHQRSC